MKKTTCINHKKDAGFTLVELAIVMIIIGLLIGGVLKGQELINNAQVAATISQVKATDAGINTFRDTYSGYPGDILAPATRIPNCAGVTACARPGNGNGRLTLVSPAATTTNSENLSMWLQLANAGMISGIDGSAATATFGTGLPEAEIGGGMQASYHAGGAVTGLSSTNVLSPGHYLALTSTVVPLSATSGYLSASFAARIDRKMDDGNPNGGSVRSAGAASCLKGAAYDEATNAATCSLLMGMSN